MKRALEQIIDRNTEGNYLFSSSDKAQMISEILDLLGVGRCSFFVIIRVLDKYFKTKVDAKDIEDAEQIIEKTIIGFEYQIMNIYKANE